MKFDTKRVQVIVDRDMTEKLPTNVFLHEVPILDAQFGEGSVKILTTLPVGSKLHDLRGVKTDRNGIAQFDENGPIPADEIVQLDLDDEFNRLASRYGKHAEYNMPLVEYVYRTKQGLAVQARHMMEENREGVSELELSSDDGYIGTKKVDLKPKIETPKPEVNEEDESELTVDDLKAEWKNAGEIRTELDRLKIKWLQRDSVADLIDKLRVGVLDYLDELEAEYDPDVSTKQLIAQLDSLTAPEKAKATA